MCSFILLSKFFALFSLSFLPLPRLFHFLLLFVYFFFFFQWPFRLFCVSYASFVYFGVNFFGFLQISGYFGKCTSVCVLVCVRECVYVSVIIRLYGTCCCLLGRNSMCLLFLTFLFLGVKTRNKHTHTRTHTLTHPQTRAQRDFCYFT